IAQAQGISYRKATIKAQRGEILDSSGREIAVNREGYNIVFDKAYFSMAKANDLILRLIKLLSENQTEWTDNLPMETTSPYGFTDNTTSVSQLKNNLGLAHYATAQNCFDEMVQRYELEAYDDTTKRLIMGVRYSLESANFSISNPFTFSEDVSSGIMQTVLEAGMLLDGVTINVVPFRQYVNGTLAPHLIGTVGPIYAEEWDDYKGKGYSYDDKVGKSGIEALAEDKLHGVDGEITYKIDAKGKIISKEITKTPIAGKTVVLNLDKTIQLSTQDALKNAVDSLKEIPGHPIKGAAAVMLDVKTGGVIASANYPSYDLNTFSEDFEALAADKRGTPLADRAFQGIFPAGSTVKPAVAVAALEEGVYNASEVIFCSQKYKRYADYQPNCMHYHGTTDLNKAISKSCNYFFFELGYRLKLSNINKYFKRFGLGVKTGVEVNDSKGLLVESSDNESSGNTLQAAIGQMNAFTPLQLAVYVSTMANEGVRYEARLVDRIVSYDMSKTYETIEPVIAEQFEISKNTINAVKAGMLSVTVDGTGGATFANYSIKVGGKTGTSQVANGADHSVFIAFAPFDKPEIAVAIVLENGSSSRTCSTVAREMFDAYFFAQETTVDLTQPNKVIG
ncbi:MAG: penicillin-binding protein, partial [Clostridia bacterium]|nr:penicillin-binding protein [Clostridia bacterium]